MNKLENYQNELLPQAEEELPLDEDAGKLVSDIHKHAIIN